MQSMVTTKTIAKMRRLVDQLERLGEELQKARCPLEAAIADVAAYELSVGADKLGHQIRAYERAVREVK